MLKNNLYIHYLIELLINVFKRRGNTMLLEWQGELKTIVARFSDDTVIEFPSNTWSRSRLKYKVIYHDNLDEMVSSNIFNCINNYWMSQPHEKILLVESLYKEIYQIMTENTDILEINNLLYAAIAKLMDTFEWNSFKTWCKLHGGLNFEIGIKETMGENDSAETTYFTEDYENVLVFSVLLKAIVPIWGLYFNIMKTDLGPNHVLLSAVNLIRNNYTDVNPAFQKLESHVQLVSRDRIHFTGFSITSDIGSEEIPEFMMALTLWKKVCIFDGKAHGRSIISDIYEMLKDKCKRINTGGPTQKIVATESGDELSIVDSYKIVARCSPAIPVLDAFYIKSKNFIKHIDENLDAKEIRALRDSIPKDLEILNFYIPILGMVINKVISIRDLYLVNYETYIDIIAISSCALKLKGFLTLSQLLITKPQIKNIYSITYTGNKLQIPINEKNINILREMYRYAGPVNPGLTMIEEIIKEVNSYTFDIKYGDIENLTNELAELLISLEK